MAKVKAPLLSLSASGKFGNWFEIRATSTGHQIIPIRKTPDRRNDLQQNQSTRFTTAISAWNALSQPQKNAWKAAAATLGKIGYRLYLSEYLNQAITPPGQPQLP